MVRELDHELKEWSSSMTEAQIEESIKVRVPWRGRLDICLPLLLIVAIPLFLVCC